MKNKPDTKYLIKQRKVWYFRYIIPDRYLHAFSQREYKRTTQMEHLDKAIEVRDYMLIGLKAKFKAIDSGGEYSIPEIAKKHLKELTALKQAQFSPDVTDNDKEALDELIYEKHREIVDDASSLFIPRGTTQEEINKASVGSDGHQYEVEAVKNLDKTGKAVQFLKDATGEMFNAYIEEYIKKKTEDGYKIKKTNAYRKAINEFSDKVKVENLNAKAVRKWGRDKVLEEGLQPSTIITKTQFLNDYLKFVAEDIEASWANILSPFPLKTKDLPRANNTNKDRKAWTMEEMKLIYQADTIQIKNKPELKDLMALGMIYGCRLEEFMQIEVSNIVYEENLRCIYIDKSKTDAYHPFGQRHLPIIERLNPIIDRLIEGKQPEDFLIETLTTATKPDRGDNIGGSFNRHKHGLGFPRPKQKNYNGEYQQVKDFHSFRSTVNNNLTLMGLVTTQRESICGWGTAMKSKSMADTHYLENRMAYPLVERLKHLEQWAEKFSFSF
jgi:integrase